MINNVVLRHTLILPIIFNIDFIISKVLEDRSIFKDLTLWVNGRLGLMCTYAQDMSY